MAIYEHHEICATLVIKMDKRDDKLLSEFMEAWYEGELCPVHKKDFDQCECVEFFEDADSTGEWQ